MASDHDLVACNEKHEMEYILNKYSKRTTNENIEKMTTSCKKFKSDDAYKPHNRENFYRYLKESGDLNDME
ncbi:MAG: hypothetical protein ABUK01_15950 [Leptospirales bacterium]